MNFIGIDDHGYDYFDEGRYVLFSSDNTHNDLFDYVAMDLSELPKMLEQYISKKIDIATFNLNDDYQYNENDSIEIKKKLMLIHPYYEHEFRKVIIKAIGDYFNKMLLYSIYGKKEHTIYCKVEKKWYVERITALLSSFLLINDKYPEEFYAQYKKRVNTDSYSTDELESIEETFVFNVPKKQPIGFDNEILTQKAVHNMLFFILDISAKSICELTTPQRMWLYAHIFEMECSQSEMDITRRLFFQPMLRYKSGHDYSLEVDHKRRMHDMFTQLYSLSKSNIGSKGIPLEMMDHLNSAIEYAKTISKSKVYEEYEINNLHQLLYMEILSMIQANTSIRKCKHCGKYFVITDRKVAYCSRANENGELCSAVGSKRSFQKKMEEDYPLKIYNRSYKTHHARVKAEIMSHDRFVKWRDEAKKKLKEARRDPSKIPAFEEWLKK